MISGIFRRIVSVVISAVLVLPLFACSAEKPVMDLFEAYISEKDSVIREKPEKEPEKEAEAAVPEKPESSPAAAVQSVPVKETAEKEPVRKKEVKTSVETVKSEVVAEVEEVREEEAAPAAEEAAQQEEIPEEPPVEVAALNEAEEAAEVLEGPEAADAYEEESLPPSLGSGAVALSFGSGSGHFLKMDEEGTFLTLTILETVYDVRIGSSGEGAHEYASSFQSDTVEGGTTITIQARISSDEPDISISWTSSEGYGYLKYISVSAKDGVPMLVAVE